MKIRELVITAAACTFISVWSMYWSDLSGGRRDRFYNIGDLLESFCVKNITNVTHVTRRATNVTHVSRRHCVTQIKCNFKMFTTKHSYTIKPVPKPVPPAPRRIRAIHRSYTDKSTCCCLTPTQLHQTIILFESL